MERCSTFVLDFYARKVYIAAFASSGAPMSSLQAARQDRAAGGLFAHGSHVNELRGWRLHGRSGVFPLVDAPAGRILHVIHSSNYGEVRRPTTAALVRVQGSESRANSSGKTTRNSERLQRSILAETEDFRGRDRYFRC
jgi:hypothetical protein